MDTNSMNPELARRAADTLARIDRERTSETTPTANTDRSLDTIMTSAHPDGMNDGSYIPAPPTVEEQNAAMGIPTPSTSDVIEVKAPKNDESITDDSDETILVNSADETPPVTEEDETVILTSIASERLGNVPADNREQFISQVMPEITAYKKNLIIEQGLTPAEAAKAAENRMKNSANTFAENWAKEHPEGVILTIDKSQEKDLHLDDDTLNKVQNAKMIKLVAVESRELETLNVKPASVATIQMSRIRDLCDSISRYSVPLLSRGDYAFFNGAQSGALVNATAGEDDDLLDIVEKKASLLYSCFSSAMTFSKKKPDGSEVSYGEFCNWYKYQDIDLGVYAIVTASTMEESESRYKCQNQQCGKSFNITYNTKALLDLSEIPEMFKKRVEEIDAHRSSYEYMKALADKCDEVYRFRSPFSGNIVELGNPSIAVVRNRLDKCMSQINNTNFINLLMLIYVDKLMIKDQKNDSYYLIDANEDPAGAFDIFCHLHQVDIELISKQITQMQYSPQFKIHVKCPHCGRETTDPIDVDNLIFLHARASLTEIQ